MGIQNRLDAVAERLGERVTRSGERLEERRSIVQGRQRGPGGSGPPAPLTATDVDSFMEASGEAADNRRGAREDRAPRIATPADLNGFTRWVGKRNPQRLHRLGKDIDWLRREAKRYGIHPEEIKWLL